jgi:hypothetical protein
MSDLNFSLASGAKPMVREAANMNNDGGGGNLGYMRRRQKDKKDRKQIMSESIFGKRQDDVISIGKDIEFVEEEGSVSNFVGKIFDKIKKTVGF